MVVGLYDKRKLERNREMTITFTMGDLQAENLLIKARIAPMTTKQHCPIHSGDFIIALAEKIKAQRMTLAMQKNSEGEIK